MLGCNQDPAEEPDTVRPVKIRVVAEATERVRREGIVTLTGLRADCADENAPDFVPKASLSAPDYRSRRLALSPILAELS